MDGGGGGGGALPTPTGSGGGGGGGGGAFSPPSLAGGGGGGGAFFAEFGPSSSSSSLSSWPGRSVLSCCLALSLFFGFLVGLGALLVGAFFFDPSRGFLVEDLGLDCSRSFDPAFEVSDFFLDPEEPVDVFPERSPLDGRSDPLLALV